MGCSSQDLMTALCTHKIQADEDTIEKKLTLKQVFTYLNISLFHFLYVYLGRWGRAYGKCVKGKE